MCCAWLGRAFLLGLLVLVDARSRPRPRPQPLPPTGPPSELRGEIKGTNITNSATVPAGATATITLSTNFASNVIITVVGTLKVVGGSTRITLLGGFGFLFQPNSIGIFQNVAILSSLATGTQAEVVSISGGSVSFTDVEFGNITTTAIGGSAGSCNLTNVKMAATVTEGVRLAGAPSSLQLSVHNSDFACSSNCIAAEHASLPLIIDKNRFYGCGKYAISLYAADGDAGFRITSNTFRQNKGVLLAIGYCSGSRNTSNCLFESNDVLSNLVDTASSYNYVQGNALHISMGSARIAANRFVGNRDSSIVPGSKVNSFLYIFESVVEMTQNNFTLNTDFQNTIRFSGYDDLVSQLHFNLFSNAGNSFELMNENGKELNATHNFWGRSNYTEALKRISQFSDIHSNWGHVVVSPYLVSADFSSQIATKPGTPQSGVTTEVAEVLQDPVTEWNSSRNLLHSVSVPAGKLLRITGNTTITMAAGVSIIVDGDLFIDGNGTKNSRVTLQETPTGNGEPWGKIWLRRSNNSGTVTIKNARFINGGNADINTGAALDELDHGAFIVVDGRSLVVLNSSFGLETRGRGVAIPLSSGITLTATLGGNLTAISTSFTELKGNGIEHRGASHISIKQCTFSHLQSFPIVLSQGSFEITDNKFISNKGVVCTDADTPGSQHLPIQVVSSFSQNFITGNSHLLAGSSCWENSGATYALVRLGVVLTNIQENKLKKNMAASEVARQRGANQVLLAAYNPLDVSSNTIEGNTGIVQLGSKFGDDEATAQRQIAFVNNVVTKNGFFRIVLVDQHRALKITSNRIDENQYAQAEIPEKVSLFSISATLLPDIATMYDNEIMANEFYTYAIEIFGRMNATLNVFNNPYCSYELHLTGGKRFVGRRNYWGHDDDISIRKRIQSDGKEVNPDWYARWWKSDNSFDGDATTLKRPTMENLSFSPAFVGLMLVIFLMVVAALLGLYFNKAKQLAQMARKIGTAQPE